MSIKSAITIGVATAGETRSSLITLIINDDKIVRLEHKPNKKTAKHAK